MPKNSKQDILHSLHISVMAREDYLNHFDAFYELFAENTRGHVIDQEIKDEYILQKAKEIHHYMETGDVLLLGMFDDSKLIGFLWAYKRIFLEELRYYINSLIVSDLYRGQGLGRLMIIELEKIAIQSGVHVIDVSTATFKTDAIRFYENLGFVSERIQLRKQINRNN